MISILWERYLTMISFAIGYSPVALRQLRKLELSSLGWTERSYEKLNELLQQKQQSRKTAVNGCVELNLIYKFYSNKLDCK